MYRGRGRHVVKVLLSKEQRKILDEIAEKLGQSESETMRMALMDYAKELNVLFHTMNKDIRPLDKPHQ